MKITYFDSNLVEHEIEIPSDAVSVRVNNLRISGSKPDEITVQAVAAGKDTLRIYPKAVNSITIQGDYAI